MLNIVDILIFILLFLNIAFLILGYLIGKTNQYKEINSFYNKNKHSQDILGAQISIDDTKIVSKIKTDGLEKKYDSLGETQNTKENITSSINKLKNMKG